jgi:hypothetical protein
MKTAIFLIMAVAALGALGVTTAIMSSTTPVHAVASCHSGDIRHIFVCPPGSGVQPKVCNDPQGCRNIGQP